VVVRDSERYYSLADHGGGWSSTVRRGGEAFLMS
jgi:hypothetical protein